MLLIPTLLNFFFKNDKGALYDRDTLKVQSCGSIFRKSFGSRSGLNIEDSKQKFLSIFVVVLESHFSIQIFYFKKKIIFTFHWVGSGSVLFFEDRVQIQTRYFLTVGFGSLSLVGRIRTLVNSTRTRKPSRNGEKWPKYALVAVQPHCCITKSTIGPKRGDRIKNVFVTQVQEIRRT